MKECSLTSSLQCRNCINQYLFPCPLIGAEVSDSRNIAESRVSLYMFVFEIEFGACLCITILALWWRYRKYCYVADKFINKAHSLNKKYKAWYTIKDELFLDIAFSKFVIKP